MDAALATNQTAAAGAADGYSASVYPYIDVTYITAYYAGHSLGDQGSGVIIGPHTVLTAAHVVWNADYGEVANDVTVYPGYSDGGSRPILGPAVIHTYQVNDAGGLLTNSDSQSDFAIIDFATDISAYGSFGIETNFAGGTVHVTGYPGTVGGLQQDQVGTVTRDPIFNLLDYGSISASPGNSGGPVWVNQGTAANPLPYVVGVISTVGHAVLLTPADLQTIQGWESSDAALFASSTPPASGGGALHAQAGATDVEGTSGADTINGWSGGDYLRGNDGNDSIIGGSGFDDVNGNKGDDTIDGGLAGGSDWLVGGQGNDLITAHTGDGLLYGNLGNDTLVGGIGSEIVRGGQGNDSLSGGPGNDFVSGDKGADTMSGGSGADIFHSSIGAGIDKVMDFSRIQGDYVLLDAGSTYAVAQSGADTIVTLGAQGAGDEVILVGVSMSSLTNGWIVVAV
jgi:Ca2+-binding RTX toxin-like protein